MVPTALFVRTGSAVRRGLVATVGARRGATRIVCPYGGSVVLQGHSGGSCEVGMCPAGAYHLVTWVPNPSSVAYLDFG
jgi:hypothetical protein